MIRFLLAFALSLCATLAWGQVYEVTPAGTYDSVTNQIWPDLATAMQRRAMHDDATHLVGIQTAATQNDAQPAHEPAQLRIPGSEIQVGSGTFNGTGYGRVKVKIVVGSDGTAEVTFIELIELDASKPVTIGGVTTPPDEPDDPDDPDPPTLSGLALIAKQAAQAVNQPEVAEQLAQIYQAAANSPGDYSQSAQAAKIASDLYLAQIGAKDAWAAARKTIEDELALLAQRGVQPTKDHLSQIAVGFAAAVGGDSAAVDNILGGFTKWLPVVMVIVRSIINKEPIDWVELVEIISQILRGSRAANR